MDLYKKISIEEYKNYNRTHTKVPFDENEIKSFERSGNKIISEDLYIRLLTRKGMLIIDKYEDDWYLIHKLMSTSKCYKCDTFDGVRQYLSTLFMK